MEDRERLAAGGEMFPAEFAARMSSLLGEQVGDFLEALADRSVGLRVNELRLPADAFERISPFELEPLPYPRAGYVVREGPRPGKHPYHAAGLYYLQDPGAMVVGALVDPRPGERVLDVSAAPGGKATHMASLMEGQGLLVANDVSGARARELAGNLERMGVRNAVVTRETPERLARCFGAFFDRVLVDAPCSGESMFCKSDAARREWSTASVQGCARRQVDLLDTAARLVRPGGTLVYSTCTFSPEENEGTVAAFLDRRDGFEVLGLPQVPGASSGRDDWIPSARWGADVRRTVRLWPHRLPGAGHYIAALRRTGSSEGGAESTPARVGIRREDRLEFEAFQRNHLLGEPFGDRFAARGAEVYALAEGLPETGDLRVLRPGLWIGTLRKNRFEPAHAAAMALSSSAVAHAVVLAADDPRTLSYLRGETLTEGGPPGWALVTVEGFPLGWGKRVGSTLKNHLPKGLRWH